MLRFLGKRLRDYALHGSRVSEKMAVPPSCKA